MKTDVIDDFLRLFGVSDYDSERIAEHDGGRNSVFALAKDGKRRYVLRLCSLGDRTEEDYRAETEFVRYLSASGAPVANCVLSARGRAVEKIGETYACMFDYASGLLISDNGYKYRDGAPLSEYFYNTGKALGAIHRASKSYRSDCMRKSFFDRFNAEYVEALIPDCYRELKDAIGDRLARLAALPKTNDNFGTVHFDFNDGNYHVDMTTGKITVFDFDNAVRFFYMFDVATLWINGTGWYQNEKDAIKRAEGIKTYFDTVLQGYLTETDLPHDMLAQLPLFIDAVLVENVTDAFETALRSGSAVDKDEIADAAECLVNNIPYAGFFE